MSEKVEQIHHEIATKKDRITQEQLKMIFSSEDSIQEQIEARTVKLEETDEGKKRLEFEQEYITKFVRGHIENGNPKFADTKRPDEWKVIATLVHPYLMDEDERNCTYVPLLLSRAVQDFTSKLPQTIQGVEIHGIIGQYSDSDYDQDWKWGTIGDDVVYSNVTIIAKLPNPNSKRKDELTRREGGNPQEAKDIYNSAVSSQDFPISTEDANQATLDIIKTPGIDVLDKIAVLRLLVPKVSENILHVINDFVEKNYEFHLKSPGRSSYMLLELALLAYSFAQRGDHQSARKWGTETLISPYIFDIYDNYRLSQVAKVLEETVAILEEPPDIDFPVFEQRQDELQLTRFARGLLNWVDERFTQNDYPKDLYNVDPDYCFGLNRSTLQRARYFEETLIGFYYYKVIRSGQSIDPGVKKLIVEMLSNLMEVYEQGILDTEVQHTELKEVLENFTNNYH